MKIFVLIITAMTFSVLGENLIEDSSEKIVGINEKEIVRFLGYLKRAIKENDKSAVSSLVSFPFKTFQKGKRVEVYSKQTFLKHYDSIFNEKVKKAILDQTIKDLFINSKGVMIGNGELWFGKVLTDNKFQIKIIAIN